MKSNEPAKPSQTKPLQTCALFLWSKLGTKIARPSLANYIAKNWYPLTLGTLVLKSIREPGYFLAVAALHAALSGNPADDR